MTGIARAWAAYAVSALLVVAVLAGVGLLIADATARSGLLVAAAVAWVVQLAAFAGLLAVRDRPGLFLAGFVGGMLLRVGMVVGAGLWLQASGVFPALPTMIGFVAFLFVLLLLEAVFVRRGEPGGR